MDDGTIDLSKFGDAIIETGKYEDTLYMVSMGITFTCYIVNNELAEQYGVTLPAYDEDWTWALGIFSTTGILTAVMLLSGIASAYSHS